LRRRLKEGKERKGKEGKRKKCNVYQSFVDMLVARYGIKGVGSNKSEAAKGTNLPIAPWLTF
jgi:hypothetical protein